MIYPPEARIPVLGFAAFSGTGKTTLLRQLIPLLKARGLRIGLIKHAHHESDIDKPGKDSYELRKAGASQVMLSSSRRRAIITEFDFPVEPSLNDELRFMDQTQLDILLVEGFKDATFPKVELHRSSLGRPLLFRDDPDIIAIALDSDTVLEPPPPSHIVRLDLNDTPAIAGFILDRYLPEARHAIGV